MNEKKVTANNLLRYLIHLPISIIMAGGADFLIGAGIWIGVTSLASFIHFLVGIDHLVSLANIWGLAFCLVGGIVFGVGVTISIFNKGIF